MTYNEWLMQCEALVPDPEVWAMLHGWQWREAYDTHLSPVTAVRFALVDTLAPEVGEVTYP